MNFENSIEEVNRSRMDDMLEVIDREVSKRIEEFPIRIFLDGKEIDISDQVRAGEEIHISIENPVYFSETEKLGFVTIEPPKKTAV